MDYFSIDPEITETLDILRPPVKRESSKIQQEYIGYVIGDSDKVSSGFVRNLQIYKTEFKKTSKPKQRAEESLPSLILQKTCKAQILEKYSYIDSESTQLQLQRAPRQDKGFGIKDRPVIKVTVIPKANQKPISVFNTNNKDTTRKTSSNDENSIQAKNVYLVVAGGKKEKIYEIKTTGSAKTLRDKDVKKLYENKRIFKCKMEKKKKKSPNEGILEESEWSNDIACLCKCAKHNQEKDIHAGSSRVRIVGRIGLNDDDEYVMKCAATVNGQPVSTRDYNSDLEKNTRFGFLPTIGRPIRALNESQGTQVDINVKIETLQTDQNIQCNSSDVCKENNFNEETKINNLKGSTSPLVIISVYPKQETNAFANTKPVISPNRLSMQNYRPLHASRNEGIEVNTFEINTDFQKTREPSTNGTKMESNKKENLRSNQTTTTKTYRASRSASPVKRSLISQMQESKLQNFTETNVGNNNASNQSTKRIYINDKIRQKDMNTSKQNKKPTINNRKEVKQPQNSNVKSQSRARDKGVNTDKVKTNTVSIERFTKKNTNNTKKANANKKKKNILNKNDVPMDNVTVKSYPKNYVSKVSVNIDSEKEFYDVVFEKGKLTTDLTVRKTTKENGSQKYFEEYFEKSFDDDIDENRMSHTSHVSDSLENFFPVDMIGRHRRSASQPFNNVIEGFPLTEHTSRLNVRDSLEISHRRDGKDSKTEASKRIFEYNSSEDYDGNFFAPVKHFTGDNCVIRNPVERDKEIRELLGVNKTRNYDKQTDEIKENVYRNGQKIHSLFHSTFCESLVTQLMIRKSCSCPSCIKKKMAKASKPNNINCHKKEEENSSDDEQVDSILETRKQVKEENTHYFNRIAFMINQSTQYEALERSSNRNRKDLFNPQSFPKQKAIQLSRKQYGKVKKSILKPSGKRQKRKLTWNSSIVSVGNVKAKTRSEYLIYWNKEVQTDSPIVEVDKNKDFKMPMINESKGDGDYQKSTVVLFSRDKKPDKVNDKIRNAEIRKLASSVEIRYTSIAYMKEVACSFTNIESYGSSNLQRKKHKSIETIFRSRKKPRTPNLGASALSLLSEDVKSVSKSESLSPDIKPKKPFLRRLMSCLVMRSARVSEVKVVPGKKRKPPTMNSSIDSYHISTSLGAIEMGSSLYDTSASFYSNHTIGPVNTKMKRGFLSSVRGFLTTTRRS